MAQYGQTIPNFSVNNSYVDSSPLVDQINKSEAGSSVIVQQINESVPATQTSFAQRRMLKWLVPEAGIIEMYINPQAIDISQAKLIKTERTKGGFIVQYWGEDLINISIRGHTGSSGIEGINVLNDIYRGEQIAFDLIALEEFTKYQQTDEDFMNLLMPQVGSLLDVVSGLEDGPKNTVLSIPKPTLGYYASTVEMYWMGEVYRGFFTGFTFNETAEQLGLYTYDIKFVATQKRGKRRNNFVWQHSPDKGPSDHQSIPYTYENKKVPYKQDQKLSQLTKEQAIRQAGILNR